MSAADTRYDPIGAVLPALTPPITRAEAERAAFAIFRHFGKAELRSAIFTQPITFHGKASPVWLSKTPRPGSEPNRGWPRLIHDCSHRIFRRRHPSFRPHDGGHATLEREIAEFVVAKGFLDGALRPKEKPKATTAEVRARRLAGFELRLKRWETKRRRAETAIKNLKRQHRVLARRIAKETV